MVALVQSDCAEELLELSEFSESPFDPGGLTGEAKAKHILRAASVLIHAGWSRKDVGWIIKHAARGSIVELENDIGAAKAGHAGAPRDPDWPPAREDEFCTAVRGLLGNGLRLNAAIAQLAGEYGDGTEASVARLLQRYLRRQRQLRNILDESNDAAF